MTTKLKHGEDNVSYDTGAVRGNSEGKGRFDLLPAFAIYRLARHFEEGAKKYADRNWEKGIPLHRYLDSALRHIFRYLSGCRAEDHLSASVWNLLCFIETEQRIKQGKLPEELNTISHLDSLGSVKWVDFYSNEEN